MNDQKSNLLKFNIILNRLVSDPAYR